MSSGDLSSEFINLAKEGIGERKKKTLYSPVAIPRSIAINVIRRNLTEDLLQNPIQVSKTRLTELLAQLQYFFPQTQALQGLHPDHIPDRLMTPGSKETNTDLALSSHTVLAVSVVFFKRFPHLRTSIQKHKDPGLGYSFPQELCCFSVVLDTILISDTKLTLIEERSCS